MARPTPPALRRRALEILRAGGTHAEAAKAAGVGSWATLRWARRWRKSGELKRPARPTAPRASDEARGRALEVLRAGGTLRAAGRAAGTTDSAVAKWRDAWRLDGTLGEPTPTRPLPTALLLACARTVAEGRAKHDGSSYDRRPGASRAVVDQATRDPRWGEYVSAVAILEREVAEARRRRGRAADRAVEHVIRAAEHHAAQPFKVTAA